MQSNYRARWILMRRSRLIHSTRSTRKPSVSRTYRRPSPCGVRIMFTLAITARGRTCVCQRRRRVERFYDSPRPRGRNFNNDKSNRNNNNNGCSYYYHHHRFIVSRTAASSSVHCRRTYITRDYLRAYGLDARFPLWGVFAVRSMSGRTLISVSRCIHTILQNKTPPPPSLLLLLSSSYRVHRTVINAPLPPTDW